jgi:hypothetical protein
MTQLIRYEAACRALAECKQIDEVKDIADKAAAMLAYGRMANDKTLEVDAAEIRIRAERRLGEMILAQKAEGGLNPAATLKQNAVVVGNDHGMRPTLKSAGISKDLSARSQKLAQIPEPQFEQEMAEHRERVSQEGARVTARLESLARDTEPREGDPKLSPNLPVPRNLYDKMLAERNDAVDRAADLAIYIEACDALEKGEEHKKIIELEQQLRSYKQKLDDALVQNNQLKTQIKIEKNNVARIERELNALKRQREAIAI